MVLVPEGANSALAFKMFSLAMGNVRVHEKQRLLCLNRGKNNSRSAFLPLHCLFSAQFAVFFL